MVNPTWTITRDERAGIPVELPLLLSSSLPFVLSSAAPELLAPLTAGIGELFGEEVA